MARVIREEGSAHFGEGQIELVCTARMQREAAGQIGEAFILDSKIALSNEWCRSARLLDTAPYPRAAW